MGVRRKEAKTLVLQLEREKIKINLCKSYFTLVNTSYQLDGPKTGRCEFFGTVVSEKFLFIVFKSWCNLLTYCACELIKHDDFLSGNTV